MRVTVVQVRAAETADVKARHAVAGEVIVTAIPASGSASPLHRPLRNPFDRFLNEPPTPAEIDAILEQRNIDGKVPLEIANRILDDMARMSTSLRRWTCGTYHMYGLHKLCPHHEGRRAVA
ncbi:MAG: hypothetical protein ACOYXU_02010 [Nitrospirota bacterium]